MAVFPARAQSPILPCQNNQLNDVAISAMCAGARERKNTFGRRQIALDLQIMTGHSFSNEPIETDFFRSSREILTQCLLDAKRILRKNTNSENC